MEEFRPLVDVFAPPPSRGRRFLGYVRAVFAPLTTFVIVAVMVLLPLQGYTYYQGLVETRGKILDITNQAVDSLLAGQQSATNFDLSGAAAQFAAANAQFAEAQREVAAVTAELGEVLRLVPSTDASMAVGQHILAAGQKMAQVGEVLARSGNRLARGGTLADYYRGLVQLNEDANTAMALLTEVQAELDHVSLDDIPAEHRLAFGKAIEALPVIRNGLIQLHTLDKAVLKVLGGEGWQRYLLIFENNNELRATGGFMGSFAVLDIERGEIKNLFIPGGGTYDVQGQLEARVIAPEPLQLVKARWEFQDSNWWPDVPTTAPKIQWFYQNAWKQNVDGTIFITATMVERLLELTGPIEMEEYGRTITAENFVAETQKIVEVEYDRVANRPKQFLGDLAPKLLERLFALPADKMPALLTMLQQSITEKDVLGYFNDAEVQTMVRKLGWAGELRQTDGDYLALIHTNVAGGKTDGIITQKIDHHAEVQADGSVIDTLTVTRTHTGTPSADQFTGVQNNSYLRVYVPQGSELLSAEGFERPANHYFKKVTADLTLDADLARIETNKTKDRATGTDIYDESGKTVFGNWLQLKPGKTKTLTLRYRLPFRVAPTTEAPGAYSLLIQKQPGAPEATIQSRVQVPSSLRVDSTNSGALMSDERSVLFSSTLIQDRLFHVSLISS
jgi:hypothetical protein